MNTHVNPDAGVRHVAPGIECHEIAVGANVTVLTYTDGAIYAGLGDGRVVGVQDGRVDTLATHNGAVTGLCLGADGHVISVGQDGRICSSGAELMRPRQDWINKLCQSPDKARLAIAAGKSVDVIEDGKIVASLDDFSSTVSDLQFFDDGKRLAISHYGGISIWTIDRFAKPERLEWAGSMTSVSISPDGRFVAGATQDREVHIWDLVTDRDFRLGGYRTKVKAMGWTVDTPYLYTTGADALVAWGLAGDPGAFPPKEIGYAFAESVSAVCATARSDLLPAGFTDGSIILGEVSKGTAKIARAPSGAAITGMAHSGEVFCFGTKGGEVGVFKWDL